MKKTKQKRISLILALIMAVPMVFAVPSTSSADSGRTATEESILFWDFTEGATASNDGSEYFPASLSRASNNKLRTQIYNTNTYSYQSQYNGLTSKDGFVFYEGLASALDSTKDVKFTFRLDFGGNMDANHGVFAIGSARGSSNGEASFNDVVYMKNDGNVIYRADGGSTNIGSSSITTSTKYTFEVYFKYSTKELFIKKDGTQIAYKQDAANLSVSDFNFFAISVWQNTYYGNTTLEYIEVSQPMDYAAVAKAKINSIASQENYPSGTVEFYTTNSDGQVTSNILYTKNDNDTDKDGNADKFYDSNAVNFDLDSDSDWRFETKLFVPSERTVYLYTGDTSKIKMPVINQNTESKSITDYGFNYIASANADWKLQSNWKKCTDWRGWTPNGASGSLDYKTNVGYNDTFNHADSTDVGFDDRDTYFSNMMYYNGTVGNNEYVKSIATPQIYVSVDATVTTTGCGASTTRKDNKVSQAITASNKFAIANRILNYVPMKNAIAQIDSSFKSLFNTVSSNEWMYDETELKEFYKGVAMMGSFDLANYDFGHDGGVYAAASDMSAAITQFTNHKTEPAKKTFNVTFKNKAGATVNQRTITAGNALGDLPANTASDYNSNNQHNVYSWPASASDVIRASTDYTESSSTAPCDHNTARSHTAATANLNGYTDYECSVCGNSDEANRVWDEQTWTTYTQKRNQYTETTGETGYAAKYTTSSKTAYTNAYTTNTLDTTDKSIPQTRINSAATNIDNAYKALDKVADLTYLQNEYDKANTFLKSLDGKTAEYTKDSINDLIDAIKTDTVAGGTGDTAETIATASAATKADYGQAVQTEAGTLADGIKDAMAGLEKAGTIETVTDASAFNAAVEALNNIDPDAYTISDADIASLRNSANVGIKDSTAISYNGATISVLKGDVSQQAINDATSTIVTGLNVRTKSYPITKSDEGDTSFDISARTGTYEDGSATYGTTLICDSEDEETAWYLEIQTGSMHKKMAFQHYGARLKTKVLGETTIKAVKKQSDTQKTVRVIRKYGDEVITDDKPLHLQLVDYVDGGSDFTLPAAPAIAYYTFDKYYIGETGYAPGANVTINDDTDIYARYTANPDAEYAVTATARTGGTDFNDSVAYNTKIELEGGSNAYAWVEESDSTGTHFRPFFIGSDVSFFANETTNLKAVTKAEFDAYKFNLPTINLRKSGVTTVNGKTTFNAQIVPNGVNVQEYGILIAAPTGSSPAASIDETKVIIENSGEHPSEGYSVLRAKSTRLVGANQFAIAVNSIPSGYVYRGYLIYSDSDGTLHNVYSQAMR